MAGARSPATAFCLVRGFAQCRVWRSLRAGECSPAIQEKSHEPTAPAHGRSHASQRTVRSHHRVLHRIHQPPLAPSWRHQPRTVDPAADRGLPAASGSRPQALVQQRQPRRQRLPLPVRNRAGQAQRAAPPAPAHGQSAPAATRVALAPRDQPPVRSLPPSGPPNAAANPVRQWASHQRGLPVAGGRHRLKPRPHDAACARRQRRRRPLHPAEPEFAGCAAHALPDLPLPQAIPRLVVCPEHAPASP